MRLSDKTLIAPHQTYLRLIIIHYSCVSHLKYVLNFNLYFICSTLALACNSFRRNRIPLTDWQRALPQVVTDPKCSSVVSRQFYLPCSIHEPLACCTPCRSSIHIAYTLHHNEICLFWNICKILLGFSNVTFLSGFTGGEIAGGLNGFRSANN